MLEIQIMLRASQTNMLSATTSRKDMETANSTISTFGIITILSFVQAKVMLLVAGLSCLQLISYLYAETSS